MNNFKVLVVSRAFYPTNSPRSFRTTELAIELSKQGYNVTVLTPKLEMHNEFEIKHNTSGNIKSKREKEKQVLTRTGGLHDCRSLCNKSQLCSQETREYRIVTLMN